MNGIGYVLGLKVNHSKLIPLLLMITPFGMLFPQSLLGANLFHSDCSSLFQASFEPQYDSSIEVELATSAEVLQLFTTPDDRLSGLIREKPLSPELRWILKNQFPTFENRLAEIPWDQLSPELQKKLVAWTHQGQLFSDSRIIHGLIPKKSIRILLQNPIILFGKRYEPGFVEFPLREILSTEPFHFTHPESIETFSGIEIHFRKKIRPSQNLEGAWRFLEIAGLHANTAHQHIVGKFSKEKLAINPLLESSRLVEFHRRLNLYTEMLRLLNGKPIETIEQDGISRFDSLHQSEFQDDFLRIYLSITGTLRRYTPTLYRNIAYVSLRFPGTYDGDEPLFGFEFRTLSKKDSPDVQAKIKTLMDQTQSAIDTLNYGLPRITMIRWLALDNESSLEKSESKKTPFSSFVHRIKNLYYNPLPTHDFLEVTLGSAAALKVYEQLDQATKTNNAIPMLTHPWAQDPLFFENLEAQKQMKNIQRRALQRVLAGEKPGDALIYFIKKSGLFRVIEASLGQLDH